MESFLEKKPPVAESQVDRFKAALASKGKGTDQAAKKAESGGEKLPVPDSGKAYGQVEKKGKPDGGSGEMKMSQVPSPSKSTGDGKMRIDGRPAQGGPKSEGKLEKFFASGKLERKGNAFESSTKNLSPSKGEAGSLPSPLPRRRGKEEEGKEVAISLELKSDPLPQVALSAFAPAHVEVPTLQTVSPSQVTRDIFQLANKLVDQILIHEAALNDKQEIHLHLKGSVLAGSQIQISQDGSTLKVFFSTATGEMADLVKQQQHILHDTLKEKLKLDQVTIQTESRQSSPNGGGDGRSRGQRDAYEEMQNRDKDEEF
jgi:type III secretion system needle length determinant